MIVPVTRPMRSGDLPCDTRCPWTPRSRRSRPIFARAAGGRDFFADAHSAEPKLHGPSPQRRLMKKFARTMLVLFFFVLASLPGTASADSFVLTSGFVDYQSYGLGTLQLISGNTPHIDFGFWGRLDAALGGRFDPAACFAGCAPGSTMSLAANWSGHELPGSALVRSVYFDNLVGGSGPIDPQMSLALSGSVLLPTPVGPLGWGREVEAPFTVAASFYHPIEASGAFVTDSISGSGTARVFLVPNTGGNWMVSSVLYNVAPTPEPATVVLLGSGLLALIARRRRLP